MNLASMEQLLDQESADNRGMSWNKLDQTTKSVLMRNYVNTTLSYQYNLTEAEKAHAIKLLVHLVQKRSLTLVKEVLYDKVARSITNIPGLLFNVHAREFSVVSVNKKSEPELQTTALFGLSS